MSCILTRLRCLRLRYCKTQRKKTITVDIDMAKRLDEGKLRVPLIVDHDCLLPTKGKCTLDLPAKSYLW